MAARKEFNRFSVSLFVGFVLLGLSLAMDSSSDDSREDSSERFDWDGADPYDWNGYDANMYRPPVRPSQAVLRSLGVQPQNVSRRLMTTLVRSLFDRVQCNDDDLGDETCATCLTGDRLFRIVGSDNDDVLDVDEFERANIVMLYFAQNLQRACSQYDGHRDYQFYQSRLEADLVVAAAEADDDDSDERSSEESKSSEEDDFGSRAKDLKDSLSDRMDGSNSRDIGDATDGQSDIMDNIDLPDRPDWPDRRDFGDLRGDIQDRISDRRDAISDRMGNVRDAMSDRRDAISDRMGNVRDAMSDRRDAISDRMDNVRDAVSDRRDAISDRMDNVRDAMSDRRDAISDRMDNVRDAMSDRKDAIQDSMEGPRLPFSSRVARWRSRWRPTASFFNHFLQRMDRIYESDYERDHDHSRFDRSQPDMDMDNPFPDDLDSHEAGAAANPWMAGRPNLPKNTPAAVPGSRILSEEHSGEDMRAAGVIRGSIGAGRMPGRDDDDRLGGKSSEEDDDRKESDEDDDNDDDNDDDDDRKPASVFRPRCLDGESLFEAAGIDEDMEAHRDDLGELAAVMVNRLIRGDQIQKTCRQLPKKKYFVDDLFDDVSEDIVLSHDDLEDMMEKLSIGDIPDRPDPVSQADLYEHWLDLYSEASQEMREQQAESLQLASERFEELVRSKRSAPRAEAASSSRVKRHTTVSTPQAQTRLPPRCYRVEELLAVYRVGNNSITKAKFLEICPSLIQQQLSEACQPFTRAYRHPTNSEKYGFGTLAILLICICSLLGAFALPCLKKTAYDLILAIFMGLAVGSLVSGAIMHLLPKAFEDHLAQETGGHTHKNKMPSLWLGLVAFIGLYVFYLIESVMTFFKAGAPILSALDADTDSIPEKNPIDHETGAKELTIDEKTGEKKAERRTVADVKGKMMEGGLKAGWSAVTALVIIGDSLHNFVDGLAIAAAFSLSLPIGMGTSVAVFCHEFPHEIGDFAILLKNGLNFAQALICNVISALAAFLGLYIGLAVAVDPSVRQWILALTAGMFLYIALVNVLPQMISSAYETGTSRLLIFLLHNLGLLSGMVIMIIVGAVELQNTH